MEGPTAVRLLRRGQVGSQTEVGPRMPCPHAPGAPLSLPLVPPQTQERPSSGAVPPRHVLCPEGGRSLLSWVDPIVVAGFSWHSEDHYKVCGFWDETPPGTAWMLGGINCAPAGMCRSEVALGASGLGPWRLIYGTLGYLVVVGPQICMAGSQGCSHVWSQLFAQLLSSVFVQPDILL